MSGVSQASNRDGHARQKTPSHKSGLVICQGMRTIVDGKVDALSGTKADDGDTKELQCHSWFVASTG